MRNDPVLVLVVITALAFDFTNGFHDTGNAMATSIATGRFPAVAVALSGLLNLVGAFLSLAVAATIASGLVDTKECHAAVVAAGLAGGIIWNLVTWLFGIPSSSSHALIGGVIGSTLAAAGGSSVLWHGLVSKVVIPPSCRRSSPPWSPRSVPGCSTGSAGAWTRRCPRPRLPDRWRTTVSGNELY